MSEIKERLFSWSNKKLKSSGKLAMTAIYPLRQEASTREYFRLNNKKESLIGVFSPPERELNEQFIFLSKFFKKRGITVPEVLFFDLKNGLMLIEDFGDDSYQFRLNENNFHDLFSSAIDEMICIQGCPINSKIPTLGSNELKNQMVLFEEWFLEGFLELKLRKKEKDLFSKLYEGVLHDLQKQPKVLCHFDFESRNLMILRNGNTGVLDFQDATYGPIFLDPVSLFKDLYLEITEADEVFLLKEYLERSKELRLGHSLEIASSIRSFDLTGLQRQLRILGTLSRLHLRDGKSFRLKDLNKTLKFVIETCNKYEEFNEVSNFLDKEVIPLLNLALKRTI
tara:strand:+ start:1192 stop:2208 length:1017 start_codon:yes stop_codon:yes gene_type:complete